MELTEDFRGNLRQVPVPMVLNRVVAARAKGTLTFSRPGEKVYLFFVGGELKTAATTKPGMRIGEMLMLHGAVEEEKIEEAIRTADPGRHGRIGKLLVEKGLLTREVLDEEIRKHFEEIFFSCFLWTDGDFAYVPSPGDLDADVAVDMPTAALIIEGVRRAPEDDRFMDSLGDPANFARATDLALRVSSLRLNSEEAYILSLCDGKTRVRDILRVGDSRDQTGRTLSTLLACGLIEIAASFAPGPPQPFDDSPLVLPIPREASPEPDPRVRLEQARAGYVDALALLEKRDYYGAILLLQDSVRLAPKNSEYRYRLAGALSHNKLWRQRAIDQYREAFRLDPMRQSLMIDFAELLLLTKNVAEALRIARELSDRYPVEASSRDLLQRCEQAAREHPEIREIPLPDPAPESPLSGLFRVKPK